MATDASPKFHQNPDFRAVPQPSDFHPEITVASHDGLEFWQFMIAGSIAGCVEHMAMFPVDTLKTRMQALGSCHSHQSFGLRQALRSVLQHEGTIGLYRGIGAMALGAAPAHAVYFSVYEFFKEYLSSGNPNNSAAHAVSGVFATVASDAVFTPMDMVKQRLQLRSSPYRGVMDCVRRVLREEGFEAFYASYRTTVLMNAPYTAVHFATYEAAKRGLMEISPESASDERLVVHATAGAAAGALAAAVTTPLDVVKTQLQCQMATNLSYETEHLTLSPAHLAKWFFL
ncbi:PREDICTED: mitoferrin-like isoform X2 [Nelumbo nucifera]|uniref:Mitoferrin-like isoform X2 n=1 Tax=Nelumbo nucifera TaxID=4432 RepID=A0A1U8Q373_NELNU|nr:PREDICTED: mitoferrin-like isoform X2 [Nelumbo nucifera]